jgi:DNA mismatch endonuclease (patch repair protein)
MMLRRELHRRGYRYRLHVKDLPGKPDLVFPSRKKVVFVHGCYWHGHDCRWGRLPKSNLDYWAPKIEANVARDAQQMQRLADAGWRAMVVWQCDLKEPERALADVVAFLEDFESRPGLPSPIEERAV